MKGKIKVVELFAGVGGFRLAADKIKGKFEFVWANQWEPGKKVQHAFDCYVRHFGESKNHVNEDISTAKENIPEKFDLLVGGFPCQDYSVAATKAKGIQGKKGVLWWEIDSILKDRKPKMVLLENVDRLLKSPVDRRGRDFAIMLKCFNENGYDVEWQVINGADYGFAQRRRRVFIYAKKRNSKEVKFPIISKAFKLEQKGNKLEFNINEYKDCLEITNEYSKGKFLNYGTMIKGKISCYDYNPIYNEKKLVLGDVIEVGNHKEFYLNDSQLEKMKQLRSSKRILRTKPNGEKYYYTEGKMELYDSLDKPSRTMLTSESTINRSTHIIEERKRARTLTPVEAERLNEFKDNWTEGMPLRNRYFCMGNALIVGLVSKIMEEM